MSTGLGDGGAGGGGQGGAAGGTGPASTGAPAAGQPASGADDPFGFAAALQGVPEANRPLIQPVLDQLAPQLQERFSRYEPLDPHLETLTPLLEADGDGNTALSGLTNLYDLFGRADDPNDQTGALESLADWWESVGDRYDLFGDDGEPGGDGEPNGLEELEPAAQQIVGQLQQQLQELQARLDAQDETTQQTAQQQEAQRIANELRDTLQQTMRENGINGADNIQSPEALDILRLAQSYGADEDVAEAIKQGTAKYMELRGLKPPAPAVDPSLGGVAALQAALGGGGQPTPAPTSPALDGGHPDTRIPSVKGWGDATRIAREQFTAAHGR